MTPLRSYYRGSKAPGAVFAILLTLGVNIALFAILAWVNHRPVKPLQDPSKLLAYQAQLVTLPEKDIKRTFKPEPRTSPPSEPLNQMTPKRVRKRPTRLSQPPIFPQHVAVSLTLPTINFAPGLDVDLDMPVDTTATAPDNGTNGVGIADESDVETPPKAVYSPNPRYPLSARKMGYTGKVTVGLIVSKDGTPDKLRIKRSSGHRSLDQSALHAIRNWRFKPARDQGTEVDVRASIEINFQIQDTD